MNGMPTPERSTASTWDGLASRSLLALCSPKACSPGDLLPLRDFVYERCGIRIDANKLSQMTGAVTVMLARHGLPSVQDLVRRLALEDEGGPRPLWEELAPQITVHETYFFRDMGQLQFFRDQVLPGVVQGKRGRRCLRMLSAGCSTGEEAYTLAMLLDTSGLLLSHWDIEIIGIDLDAAAIAVARKGAYSGFSMRATSPEQLERYFRPDGDRFVLRDRLRKLVRFQTGNLFDLPKLGLPQFDVIFCRNVIIYFDRQSQERIVSVFRQALAPGGTLLIGHSESFIGLESGLQVSASREGIFYHKPAAGGELEVANG